MSRRKEISKHPAIMANKVALAEAQSVVDVTTPGWDNLTGEQKRFAALYGIHHDIIRTATAAGVTLAWVQEQSKSNRVSKKS